MANQDIDQALLDAARQAREEAYAPYSGYLVGAAVLDGSGRVWTGANVENVSYPAGLCAERVAIAKMASAGAREVAILAVVTADGGPPCGICLQVLSEFSPEPTDVRVLTQDDARRTQEYSLAELLPHRFSSSSVKRTEPTPD